MRKLPIVILLTIVMTALSASVFAQRRAPQRTRGAKAAYGEPVDVWSAKKKSKKKSKKQKRKPTKKDAAPLYRNRSKNPWVN